MKNIGNFRKEVDMTMRKITIFLVFLVVSSSTGLTVSVDIKTKFAEKSEITAIKLGATYWLEKNGITVVNIGEDYAVWLKNLERKFVKENEYAYSLTITLSYPTSFVEKKIIKEEVVKFEIFVNTPVKEPEEGLDERLKRRFSKLKDRLKKEAYIGGLIAAASIIKLLKLDGAVK
jgi:hypothetical protein